MGPSKTFNKPCAKNLAKPCLATAGLCPLFLSQLNRHVALLIPFLSADLGTVGLVQSGLLPRLALPRSVPWAVLPAHKQLPKN